MALGLFQAASSVLSSSLGAGGDEADVMPSDMSSRSGGQFDKGNININADDKTWKVMLLVGGVIALVLLKKR